MKAIGNLLLPKPKALPNKEISLRGGLRREGKKAGTTVSSKGKGEDAETLYLKSLRKGLKCVSRVWTRLYYSDGDILGVGV